MLVSRKRLAFLLAASLAAVAATPATFTLSLTPQRLVTLSAEKAKAADIGLSLE